jgi:hypothetical protein
MSINGEKNQSTILKTLEAKSNESNIYEISALKSLIDLIEGPIKDHLSRISNQLPDFDKHDISHCYKLVENIEKLLDSEQLNELDPFELFLIYTSCLLHDAAMALPEWEYTLLKCCEGQEGFNINNLPIAFLFDEKQIPQYNTMVELIKKNKDKLYSFNDTKNFIFFCYDSEDDLISDLAKRAIAYIEYRNGFDSLHKMRENDNQSGYKNISDDIRCHFIRDTHHERVESYIKGLKPKFSDHLKGVWAKGLVDDLGFICRSHGESFDFSQGLTTKSIYFQGHGANLPFICALLRLSDILHFSYDRVPLSLFAEKQITDNESRKHWLAKLQGVSYEIKRDNKLLTIVYSAYCEDPDSWYFLRDYIKLIESEIQNYNKFYRENQHPLYLINIKDTVNIDGIKYDPDAFIPDDSLRFSLDQNRILELLMGVNLYKDKYLCLRELYQNSLDACRVMRGFNPTEEGKIEFGIGSEVKNGKERRYVYCLDNGNGMDKEIIKNHFLKIGNSYYNSPSFRRQNINAKERFNPVSQFGIGVLSCFMIGDIIDITTHSMINNETTRFIVNGPNEHFYYIKPDRQDLDLLVGHGTLVKVFLKSDEKLNEEYPKEDKEFFTYFYELSSSFHIEYEDRKYYDLFSIMQSYIFCIPEKINFSVKTSRGYKKLMDIDTQITDIYNPNDETTFWHLITDNKSKSEIQALDNLKLEKIKVEYKGIVYHNYLVLPINQCDRISFSQVMAVLRRIINPFILLNEGIAVNGTAIFFRYIKSTNGNYIPNMDFYHGSCFYINSEQRLELSVDRTDVVGIPEKLKLDIDKLLEKIAEVEINHIWMYLSDNRIPWNSNCASEVWKNYLEIQGWNFTRIINAILKSETRVYIKALCDMTGNVSSLDEIIKSRTINFRNIHLIKKHISSIAYFLDESILEYLTAILIYHSHNAISKDDAIETVLVEPDFQLKNIPNVYTNGIFFPIVAINSYSGKYMEFDFVNSFFPFIPQHLFDRITTSFKKDALLIDNNNKISLFFDYQYYTIFNGLATINSQTIFPEGVIYSYKKDIDETQSIIGRRSIYDTLNRLIEGFHFKYTEQESLCKENTILYCYYCPDSLTEEDEKEIEYYRSKNHKYVEGIINGWSVLILGGIEQVIVQPGIAKKSSLLKKIDDSFWEKNIDTKFYFPDGTHVTKEYIDTLKDG